MTTATTLTEDELAMLELERAWWRFAGAKTNAVRERFDVGMTTYYLRLNALLDSEAALAADPILVKRLRRLRAHRKNSRLP